MQKRIAAIALVALVAQAGAVLADPFRTVEDEALFLALVDGRHLTRLGIKLSVGSDGQITGRAFGRPVTGQWRWSDGFFCRDLYFGARDLGPNCQIVKVSGTTLRFVADKGAGQYADLNLK